MIGALAGSPGADFAPRRPLAGRIAVRTAAERSPSPVPLAGLPVFPIWVSALGLQYCAGCAARPAVRGGTAAPHARPRGPPGLVDRLLRGLASSAACLAGGASLGRVPTSAARTFTGGEPGLAALPARGAGGRSLRTGLSSAVLQPGRGGLLVAEAVGPAVLDQARLALTAAGRGGVPSAFRAVAPGDPLGGPLAGAFPVPDFPAAVGHDGPPADVGFEMTGARRRSLPETAGQPL